MTWTITVKPTSAALDMWAWSAMRADQESVLSGSGHRTSEAAVTAATTAIENFENSVGIIQDATFQVEYEPESGE